MARSLFSARMFVAALFVVTGSALLAQTPPGTITLRAEWTLEDILAVALRQHPLIEAAGARLEAARGSRRSAAALPNPLATYSVEGATFPGQDVVTRLESERFAYVTFPFESIFQRQPRVQRADEDIRAAEADLTATERRIARDVARTFYRVALAQMAAVAVQENRSALDRLVEYLRARVAQGASPEAELIRAEVERDQAANDVTMAEVDLVRARADLQPFLGSVSPPLDALQVNVSAASAAGQLPPLERFAERASQRAELVGGRAKVAAAQAAAAYERRLVIREMGGSFGLKRTSGINSMIAGLNFSVPLFDRNRGEIARAAAEGTAAERELEWMERTVAAEVRGSYEVARRLSVQAADLQRTFLSRAEESSWITLASYQEGAASLLQVIDATRALAGARLSYWRVVFAQRESLFELMLAAGLDPRGPIGGQQ
ncbi:MAG TPA: TolC family protein [Vicinamibacterales bacterium]|nr:TolC family protein [Vicinamibacterales bacterium]